MVNSNRYIGSDQALKMQQQATGALAETTAGAMKQMSGSVAQALEGQVQINQQMMSANAALAQAKASGYAQRSSVAEFAKVAANVFEQEQKFNKEDRERLAKLDKAAKEQQAKAKYADVINRIGNLDASYEQDNWSKGTDAYKREVAEILEQNPGLDDDGLIKILDRTDNTRSERNKLESARAFKATDDLRNALASQLRGKLKLDIIPLISTIKTQTLQEQARPSLSAIEDKFKSFLAEDNGLPKDKKLEILAQLTDDVNEAYAGKDERYRQQQSNLVQLRNYSNEYRVLTAKLNAGSLTYDAYKEQIAVLDQRYGDWSKSVAQVNEEEQLRLTGAQIQQNTIKLQEEAAASAFSRITVAEPMVRSLAAQAIFNPSIYDMLKNEPGFKDNRNFQRVTAIVDLYKEYQNANASLVVKQAEDATAFSRLDLTSANTLANLTQRLAFAEQNKQELSQQDLFVKQVLAQMNPALAESLMQQGQRPKTAAEQRQFMADLQRSLDIERDNINAIKSKLEQESRARAYEVQVKYQELQQYGLLAGEKLLRQYANESSKTTNDYLNQLLQQRSEAATQVLPPEQRYGVQPNFNPSSTYAPVTDDRGMLRLVPRAAAQVIKTADGTSIVTPVIRGANANVSGGGHYGAPRKYRNGIHYGLDFGLEGNERSIALVSGEVVHVGSAGGYGNFVDILGDNGYVYRYAHQRSLVKTGQRVSPGTAISVSDGSGVGAPHLHFEVRPRPVFSNGRYDVSSSFGQAGAIDPMKHLQELNSGSSNVLAPRSSVTAGFRARPTAKVPANSLLLTNAAINGHQHQRIGGSAGLVSERFSQQRGVQLPQAPYKVTVGRVQYDEGDDLGYAELRKDANFRKQLNATARSLGVPASWIADIARQEAGSLNAYVDHSDQYNRNGNYGLFGFGSDSFHDKSIHSRLRAGKIDAVGQLKLYEKYIRENGWDSLVKRKNGQVTIADLWALTHFGTNLRNKFLSTGDVNIKTFANLRYKDELKLLGKWVGRSYDFGGSSRTQRNRAVSNTYNSSCQLCQHLAASDAMAPHAHRIG